MAQRESAAQRILREHEETTGRASRSSSRGRDALNSAQRTRQGVQRIMTQYSEAEDRINQAAGQGMQVLQAQEAEEARIKAESDAREAAHEERKRSLSARRNRG